MYDNAVSVCVCDASEAFVASMHYLLCCVCVCVQVQLECMPEGHCMHMNYIVDPINSGCILIICLHCRPLCDALAGDMMLLNHLCCSVHNVTA